MTPSEILKQEIKDYFLPKLDNKGKVEYSKLSSNNYFNNKFIGGELLYQFFITRLLNQNGIEYILLQTEGNLTTFERFVNILKGNKRGWSDLFIPQYKCFIELKSTSPFLKNGTISNSNKHLMEQEFFLKKQRENGYFAFFMYPKITDYKFKKYLNIEL